MRATDGTLRTLPSGSAIDRIALRAVIFSTCIAIGISVFLLGRRAAGAFSLPLPMLQLVATATTVVLWAITVREFSARKPAHIVVSIAILFTLGLACSYPGGRVTDWLIWPAAMLAVAFCPPLVHIGLRRKQPLGTTRLKSDSDLPTESNSETVIQRLTRIRTADAGETIHGTLVAEFAAGERQTTLHIAFCPPFERLPEVETNVADDSDADIRLSQVLHNGAQFEVRRPQANDEAAHVAIDFFAADSP